MYFNYMWDSIVNQTIRLQPLRRFPFEFGAIAYIISAKQAVFKTLGRWG